MIVSFSKDDIMLLTGVIALFSVILSGLTFYYSKRRKTRYNEEFHRIELELMRKSIEKQMYELNRKLTATESRWKDVNHLVLASQERAPDPNQYHPQITSFLESAGITPSDLEGDSNLVFILTPFNPDHRLQYQTIASVCQNLGLRALRGDEEFVAGDVFPHILKQIVRARVVIANIDGRNPNVFYELGIAHALGKPTILLSPRPEEVPFDVRAKRVIFYKNMEDLSLQLQHELAKTFAKV
jgi:hypothetical protein